MIHVYDEGRNGFSLSSMLKGNAATILGLLNSVVSENPALLSGEARQLRCALFGPAHPVPNEAVKPAWERPER